MLFLDAQPNTEFRNLAIRKH